MHPMKTIKGCLMVAVGLLAARAMGSTQLLTFDAQTNPPPGYSELLFNAALAAGAGSVGNGDGAALGTGVGPGLTIITPLSIAPGTLGEQNNLDGSTTFFDVTLSLTGLNAAGGAGAGPFLVQNLSSGTFLFSSSKVGGGAGVPLLGGNFTSALIDGANGSQTGAVLSSTITYNSGSIYNKLISQGGIGTGNESISMNNISPVLGNSGGGVLNSFSADANGQFSVTLLPEPASTSLMLITGAALLRRRRA
jgi:hypothetical protein